MADILTFANIKTAVERVVKDFGSSKSNMLGHVINMVYMDEIMAASGIRPFFWLLAQSITRRALAPSSLSAATADNPGLFTTSAAHGLAVGDIVSFYNVSGMTELNGLQGVVATVPLATTFTTDLNTSSFTAYTSGGSVYHRGIKLAHSLDSLYQAGWNGYTPKMTFLTPDMIESEGTDHHNMDQTGLPAFCTHRKTFTTSGGELDQLLWYPAPDQTYLLRYWYIQYISRLVNDADVPLLPPRFHDILVSGTVARLTESKDKSVSVENATLWPQIYTSQLDALRAYNEKWWAHVEQDQEVKPYLS